MHRKFFDYILFGLEYLALLRLTSYQVAGTDGFEPSNAGVKVQCLTAWRRPSVWQLVSCNRLVAYISRMGKEEWSG